MPPPLPLSRNEPRTEPEAMDGAWTAKEAELPLGVAFALALAELSVSVSASASTCIPDEGCMRLNAPRRQARPPRRLGSGGKGDAHLEVLGVLVVDEPVATLAGDLADLVQGLDHARAVDVCFDDKLVLATTGQFKNTLSAAEAS